MSSFPQPPSIYANSEALSQENLDRAPFRGIPAAPSDVRSQAGSLESVLFWNAPQSMEGVDGWRVFEGDENTLISPTLDVDARQFKVKMAGGSAQKLFFVCAVSELGREGPKIAVLATSTSDQLVATGTAGATPGTPSTPPPPEWGEEGSGGDYKWGSGIPL